MRLYPFDFYALTIKEKARAVAAARALDQGAGQVLP